MFEKIRALVLRWMRVPHDPQPPAGAPESVRVFRAAENYYKFRLVGWTAGQLVGVAGIVFWIWLLGTFTGKVNIVQHAPAGIFPPEVAMPAPSPSGSQPSVETTTPVSSSPVAEAGPGTSRASAKPAGPARRRNSSVARQVPIEVIWVLRALEILGIAGFVAQLPFTLAALRLDYEMRWYIVTDRSLRIRSGIWRVQEMTMSFANVQHVAITRDPIQGLLKISDLHVQSAGGGGGDARKGRSDTLHTGIFHGVGNAAEIRDLILERLKRFRAAGLGDPDDASAAPTAAGHTSPAVVAARDLLEEVKLLRTTLG